MLGLLVLSLLGLSGCGGGSARVQSRSVDIGGASFGDLQAGWHTDFDRSLVSGSEFRSGGPGKDGIPALTRRHVASVRATTYLEPREPVIELELGGTARAYPLQILVWHEIVNDELAGTPVAVTFCPLCNTAIAFDRRVGGRTLDFGTTGNLRNSDLVMFDRATESWWQQFDGRALVGRLAGSRLTQLPARIVSWRDFRSAHPDGDVLTRETGYSRDYGHNPYPGYDDAKSPPFFPVSRTDRRLPPKARVVLVELGGRSAAVPLTALAHGPVTVSLAGHRLLVRRTGAAASALDAGEVAAGAAVPSVAVTELGRPVAFDTPFWFAVAAFRPHVVLAR